MMQSVVLSPLSAPSQRSRGNGRLSVKYLTGKSRIDRLFQEGCARIRIPTSHDQDGLEAVMINTAGGMTGGDQIDWEFTASINTSLDVTTQACERIYKSAGGAAKTNIRLTVETGARLAWLPQETILFDRAKLRRNIEINMQHHSTLLLVEPLVFGRLEMGETIETLLYQDSWRIRYQDQLIHAEELRFDDLANGQLSNAAVLNKNTCLATVMLISPQGESLMQDARKIIGSTGGASYMSLELENQIKTGKLIARIMAKDSYQLRKTLLPLLGLLNQRAHLPKCWTL